MLTVLFSAGLLAAAAVEPPPPADEPRATPAVATAPADRGEADVPREGIQADPEAEAARAEALGRYNERRDKARMTADGQWRLALWCEEQGLKAEAYAHFANVVRLDPGRVAAWKKLGFQKVDGRWMSQDQIADLAEQKKADRLWGPRVAKWHGQYHDRARQAEAEAAFASIDDPRAVPAVFREFATGGPIDQGLAIQVFGQIKGPLASKALAALAVYGVTPDVRRRATESLRSREPLDYVEALIGLLVDPLRYEVRPVGGPGSPGILFVEGERYNVRRFYAPPPPPNLVFQPGDVLGYDEFGLPSIYRVGASVPGAPTFTFNAAGKGGAGSGPSVPPGLSAALGPRLSGTLKSALATSAAGSSAVGGVGPIQVTPTYVMQYSPTKDRIEAQRGAAFAQAQLQGDIAAIEGLNKVRESFKELVCNVLKDATGEDAGDRKNDWKDWLAKKKGYAKDEPEKPTLDQLVPLAYNPSFRQLMIFNVRKSDH